MGDPQGSWVASSSSYRSSSSFAPLSSPSSSRPSSSLLLSSPSPIPIGSELWLIAEQRVQEIICTIQPLVVSDRGRQRVIEHLHKLVKNCYGVEVFPFGSVPLKTYLPDGDIDLTILSKVELVEDLAAGIYHVLLGEQKEQNPDLQIQHVNYIQAQVKVVKCDILNLSVDISFNRMEGLCALCFFEQVDQLIGKDHLFKRSIILVKAWCYYESRTLGAQSGLFSTYAVEVLVLYIINLFHRILCGPLSVLYKFLEYYGRFEWDNYCVSVNGPVLISLLENGSVEPVDNNGDDFVLSRDFLEYWKGLSSILIHAVEDIDGAFPRKHLNIIDPLKENNNLGRSVSNGNARRIRCALSAGARKLREVLALPFESMFMEIEEFFVNTIDRNGKGERQDTQTPISAFGSGKSEESKLGGDLDLYYKSLLSGQWCHGYALPDLIQPSGQPPSASVIQNTWPELTQPSDEPPPAFDIQITNLWNLVQQLAFPEANIDLFPPAPSIPYPLASQQATPYVRLQDLPISRGTGTFIPQASHFTNRDRQSRPRRRQLQRNNSRSMLGSPTRTHTAGHSSITSDVRNDNVVSSPREESPPLATTSEPAPETVQTNLGNTDLKHTNGSTSLSAQPSFSKKEADSAASPSTSGSKTVEDEPYQLEDHHDFPPLTTNQGRLRGSSSGTEELRL